MKTKIMVITGVALTLAGCAVGNPFRKRSDLVIEPSACAETRFNIYFADGQARLTQPARQLIAETHQRLKACTIRGVRVIGLADATGSSDANRKLSQDRAEQVVRAFEGLGWPAPAFDVEAAGDAGAVTGSGAAVPMRRQTVVVVDAAPAA